MRFALGCVWLVGACVQDGSPEDLQLDIDVISAPIVFSWADGRPVHTLEVGTCEDCVCEAGRLGSRRSSSRGPWASGTGTRQRSRKKVQA